VTIFKITAAPCVCNIFRQLTTSLLSSKNRLSKPVSKSVTNLFCSTVSLFGRGRIIASPQDLSNQIWGCEKVAKQHICPHSSRPSRPQMSGPELTLVEDNVFLTANLKPMLVCLSTEQLQGFRPERSPY